MVAESGAVLLDDAARAALSPTLLPRATVITPNVPEARVLAETGGVGDGREEPEELARALHRSARPTSSSPAATATRRPTCSSTATTLHEIPGERHPDGAAHGSGCTHSSALAAHLALGFSPLEAATPREGVAAEAVRNGLREIGEGAGPVDVLGRPQPRGQPRHTGGRLQDLCHNRRPMKFLRMRPGHGEQLIAEGDLEVAEDEERLVEEFRRQLDEGMWAAVPVTVARRPPRGDDGPGLRPDPAGHRPRHLLPARRAGGSAD